MTLKDIAKETGVSVSTVSRVLNGYTEGFSVKAEVREKIMACVEKNNYKPVPLLSAMRAKHSKLINSLFIGGRPSLYRGCVGTAIYEFQKKVVAEGYKNDLSIIERGEKSGFSKSMLAGMMCPDLYDINDFYYAFGEKLPFVAVNGEYADFGAAVRFDELHAVKQAMIHLAELGHTRIAYANIYFKEKDNKWLHYSMNQRLQGFLEFLEKNNMPIPPLYDQHTVEPETLVQDTVFEFGATAIVAYSHIEAIKLIHSCWKRGLSVPKDLSLISLDHDLPLHYTIPPVTCIDLPFEEMGRVSAELLLKQIKSGYFKKTRIVNLKGELRQRESTGPVKPEKG